MRGAVVGGMVGGSEGAATGAKVGVVTGATRSAIDRETQARTEYQATAEYQNAQYSNFNEAPPEILGTTAAGTAKKPSEEAVIRKNGKPIVGITFPSDWNQKTGDNYISAVSGDGHAYSMLVTLDGVADKQAAIKKVKTGLENYLKDIKYDEPSETKAGALVITGTGKAKRPASTSCSRLVSSMPGKDNSSGRHSSSIPKSRITTRRRFAASARRFVARRTSQSKAAPGSPRFALFRPKLHDAGNALRAGCPQRGASDRRCPRHSRQRWLVSQGV